MRTHRRLRLLYRPEKVVLRNGRSCGLACSIDTRRLHLYAVGRQALTIGKAFRSRRGCNAAAHVAYVTRIGAGVPTFLYRMTCWKLRRTMAYLYGMVATHPTRVDCELLEAQERRIAEGARTGLAVPAWGTAHVREGHVATRLQRIPQPYSQQTRSSAQDAFSRMALTWCPHPGVGGEVLQPLVEGASMAVIRAAVPAVGAVCSDIRGALRPRRRDALQTDALAEHVFQLLLERRDQMPSRSPVRTLRAVAWNVLRWSRRAEPEVASGDGMQTPFLQMLWNSGTGDGLAGCSIGASLWSLLRTEPRGCGICGAVHSTRTQNGSEYRSRVFATEPLTEEAWESVPEGRVFSVSRTARIDHIEPAEA